MLRYWPCEVVWMTTSQWARVLVTVHSAAAGRVSTYAAARRNCAGTGAALGSFGLAIFDVEFCHEGGEDEWVRSGVATVGGGEPLTEVAETLGFVLGGFEPHRPGGDVAVDFGAVQAGDLLDGEGGASEEALH